MKSALLLLSTLLLGMPQAPPSDAAVGGRVNNLRPGGAAAGLGVAALMRLSLGTLVYRDGRRVFQMSTTGQADAAGNYRLSSVRPGEYYLRAESLPLQGVPIYYPGTFDVDAATKIAVEAGQELVGIDFDVVNPPTFKVSGTIVSIPAAAATNGLPNAILGITFVSADLRNPDPNAAPLLGNPRAQNNGEFEVTLPAGEWDLFPVVPIRIGGTTTPTIASPPPVGTPMYATGRARVVLKDRNIENVVIRIGSSDINGRIVAPGFSSDDLARRGMRITLVPRDNYPFPLTSHLQAQTVGGSGEFTFAAVPPGPYRLQIANIPPEFYVAEMTVGSNSIYEDGVITVGTEPLDRLELLLSRGGGQVRVTINGASGTGGTGAAGAAGSSSSRIVLMPDDSRRENGLLYKTVLVNFPFTVVPAVAPGRYRVFAFQELPQGGAEQNAEYMMKYQKFGVKVDVPAGETVDVQVPWIPAGK